MAKGRLRAAVVKVVTKAQDNRNSRVTVRNERKATKQALRYNSKTERVKVRQGGKTDRTDIRQETKQTAYEHGFDPNAAWSNVAGKAVDAAGSFLTSTPYQSSGEYNPQQMPDYSKDKLLDIDQDNGMRALPIIGIFVIALIILSRIFKKSK